MAALSLHARPLVAGINMGAPPAEDACCAAARHEAPGLSVAVATGSSNNTTCLTMNRAQLAQQQQQQQRGDNDKQHSAAPCGARPCVAMPGFSPGRQSRALTYDPWVGHSPR